jgi:His-Xaa-Ser system protein HxsD
MAEVGLSQPVLRIRFPRVMFGDEALKRAAYAFMRRATVAFSVDGENTICSLEPTTVSDVDLLNLERDFRREVIDQDLRVSTELATEPLRNAILGLAFSRTGLQNE